MLEFEKSEVILMDKIFRSKFNNYLKNRKFADAYYLNTFGLESLEYKHYYKTICILGKELNLIRTKQYPNGSYAIVAYENYSCEKFIKNGGFLNLYITKNAKSKLQEEKEELEGQVLKLRRDNLMLKNWDIRVRWIIGIASFIAGLLVKHLWDK